MKFDCLFIGHNDNKIGKLAKQVYSMGKDSGNYRDLRLSIVNHDDRAFTLLDFANYLKFDRNLPDYNNDEYIKYNEMSFTILYLKSYMASSGISSDYVNRFRYQKDELIKKLQENEYSAIIIPTTFYMMSDPIIEIIDTVKNYKKDAKIIVGGPYINKQNEIMDDESINLLYDLISADYYIVNTYGEKALTNLMLAIKEGKPCNLVSNIAYRENGKYIKTSSEDENIDVSKNMVKWNLFSKKEIGKITFNRTSLSCPFSCAFCGFPAHGGKYRCTETSILEENLKLLQDSSDVEMVNFIDDTFNVPKERFREILQMMIRNKFKFKWNSTLRCQFLDDELIHMLKEAGCVGAFLGIESGSNDILKNMNKQATIEAYARSLKLLNEYDIISFASFIIGFPGETLETVEKTRKFIEEYKPTFFRTQLWYADPMTPIFKRQYEFDISGSGFSWKHSSMNARTACDCIDSIFSGINNSIWLPEQGFDFYALFNLIVMGYSTQQIKDILKSYNNLITLELKQDNNPNLKKSYIENMRRLIKGEELETSSFVAEDLFDFS